jgi:solute carrier family 35 protein F5
MLVNSIVGTVFSELLWLFGCFYTSSLVATLAISLTIPLTMFADVLLKDVKYDLLFYVGSVPMFLSFFIVAGLTHMNNWDPILVGLKFPN